MKTLYIKFIISFKILSEPDCRGTCKWGKAFLEDESNSIIPSFNKFGSIDDILILGMLVCLSISCKSSIKDSLLLRPKSPTLIPEEIQKQGGKEFSKG